MSDSYKRKISIGRKKFYINGGVHNWKGKKLSSKTKRKISIGRIGNKYAVGHKHSEEFKKKISLIQKSRYAKNIIEVTCLTCHKVFSSRKHLERKFCSKACCIPKGGKLSFQRKKAKIRDNYTCQICDLRDPEIMEVDHIKQISLYPELKFKIDNLMTLCPNCHRRKTNREKKKK